MTELSFIIIFSALLLTQTCNEASHGEDHLDMNAYATALVQMFLFRATVSQHLRHLTSAPPLALLFVIRSLPYLATHYIALHFGTI